MCNKLEYSAIDCTLSPNHVLFIPVNTKRIDLPLVKELIFTSTVFMMSDGSPAQEQ